MSYQPGRLGLAEGIALVFATTLAPIFLTIFPASVDAAGPAAWMRPVISFIEFLVILYLLLYVLKNTTGDLYAACQQLLGTTLTRLVALYYTSLYFLDAGLLLRQFAENTLLTALPRLEFEVAIGLYAIMAVFLLYFGLEAMARTCYIILPFAVAGLLAIMALAAPRYEFFHLTPWVGPGLGQVFIWGVQAGGINLGALLPFLIAASFQNAPTIRNAVLYGLGLSTLMRTLAFIAYTTAFGVSVGREKVLPFFDLARLVYINRFLQRIEAFFIILWTAMGMLNVAIDIYAGLYLLCRLFNLPSLRPFILPTTLIIAELAMLPHEITGVLTFYNQAIFSFYNLGTIVIPLMLFIAAVYRAKRGREKCRSV
ncbi:MAG TPA: GerAB/ArcD/ProY family transporter [Methylomusa anaerophila]|uniref:Spore germination protein n=1 Tax=Methylomusa anaerophila TaxID=1930071 RepID=A0A348AGZ0_9FIRM|nr:GerAB/ArcD/ProY family transporter [Methylomusa anaerophila]BBB90338.1 spore germination protein [Methylomusa anaerophila]HML89316.1 GerAB/ArcD/ProY family transporter [Methylomusa anaerophila]